MTGGCLKSTADADVQTTECVTLCTTQQPFMITFNTDGNEGSTEQTTASIADVGFRLSYIQSSSPC